MMSPKLTSPSPKPRLTHLSLTPKQMSQSPAPKLTSPSRKPRQRPIWRHRSPRGPTNFTGSEPTTTVQQFRTGRRRSRRFGMMKPRLQRSPKPRSSPSLIQRLTRLRPKPRLMSRNPKPKTRLSLMRRHSSSSGSMDSTSSLGARTFKPSKTLRKQNKSLRTMKPKNRQTGTTRQP